MSNKINHKLFDLVERDHNIRLEYRKKSSNFKIEFNESSYIVKEGTITPLSDWFTITGDKSQITHVTFTGSAAANVSNVDKFGVYEAPLYSSLVGVNTYQLSLAITLHSGHVVTTPTPVTIIVDPENVGTLKSVKLIPVNPVSIDNPVSLVGERDNNGYIVSSIVQNAAGRPLEGEIIEFITDIAGAVFSPSSVITDTTGQAQSKLTSTVAKDIPFTVLQANSVIRKSAEFIAEHSSLDPSLSALSVAPAQIAANDAETAPLTLQLKDNHNNPVAGQAVRFTSSVVKGITVSTTTDNGDGSYSATLKGTKAGATEVTVSVDNQALAVPAQTVTLIADSKVIRLYNNSIFLYASFYVSYTDVRNGYWVNDKLISNTSHLAYVEPRNFMAIHIPWYAIDFELISVTQFNVRQIHSVEMGSGITELCKNINGTNLNLWLSDFNCR